MRAFYFLFLVALIVALCNNVLMLSDTRKGRAMRNEMVSNGYQVTNNIWGMSGDVMCGKYRGQKQPPCMMDVLVDENSIRIFKAIFTGSGFIFATVARFTDVAGFLAWVNDHGVIVPDGPNVWD